MITRADQKFVTIDDSIAFIGGIDLCYGRWDNDAYAVTDPTSQLYYGRDYCNFSKVGEMNGPTSQCTVDRKTTPRMPWYDCMAMLTGQVVVDVMRNFVQRWNFTLRARVGDPSAKYSKVFASLNKPLLTLTPPHVQQDHLADLTANHTRGLQAQLLRSSGPWSCGLDRIEASIYEAWCHLIFNAKHYVYIENQYFISGIDGVEPVNKIAGAIFQRIRRAVLNHEVFRVIVVTPEVPSGDITKAATRIVLQNNMTTICRSTSGSSILERLSREFPQKDITDYVVFCSLRNYGFLEGKPVTEQVYVHAKLIIVDDEHVLIGSANVNDRSMLGCRDSELSVLLSDTSASRAQGTMDGKPCLVGQFAQAVRIQLWSVLLGLEDDQTTRSLLVDPISQTIYKELFVGRANANSEIYQTVFTNLPAHCHRLGDLDVERTFVEEHVAKLQAVRGLLVRYPAGFLAGEESMIGFSDPELILPRRTFS